MVLVHVWYMVLVVAMYNWRN